MRTVAGPVPPPSAELRFRRRLEPISWIRDLWRTRELTRTLAERSIRARYKQAVFGTAWAVLVPLFLMVVFSFFFKKVAKINTAPIPYPLFSYLGVLPWTFFSGSVSSATGTLIQNNSLLRRINCPREVFAISSVLTSAFDMAVALPALGILFLVTGWAPKATSGWAVVPLAILLTFTMGASVLLSGITVYFRDLRLALPLLLQMGLFATPVGWPVEKLGSHRVAYAVVNPLAAVVDGLRRSVLLGRRPSWDLAAAGGATSVVLLLGGLALFKKLEPGIADVA